MPRDDGLNYRKGINNFKILETKDKARVKREADSSKIKKDMFRVQMANVIVALLNPYRKPNCKVGRIQSTRDFKHLAQKLKYLVMAKELKRKSIEELDCNNKVKDKARRFVTKYMSQFGAVYTRITDDK